MSSNGDARHAELAIRFAEGDQDVVTLHRFLTLVAGPALHAPIDALASIREVGRVVQHEVAIMAEINGELVGTLGLIRVPWWYSPDVSFLTDRWMFVYPALWHRGVAARLLAEADILGRETGMLVLINGHARRRGSGIAFTRPQVLGVQAQQKKNKANKHHVRRAR